MGFRDRDNPSASSQIPLASAPALSHRSLSSPVFVSTCVCHVLARLPATPWGFDVLSFLRVGQRANLRSTFDNHLPSRHDLERSPALSLQLSVYLSHPSLLPTPLSRHRRLLSRWRPPRYRRVQWRLQSKQLCAHLLNAVQTNISPFQAP